MPNAQQVSACPSDAVLPLLPTVNLLTGQTFSCRFQGDLPSNADPAEVLEPGMESGESCAPVWKPRVSSQRAGMAILILGLCSS